MKFLFSTRLRFFWVLIPMTVLMCIALAFNGYADGLLKFYPLIVFLGACIIFTFVFLFRVVGIGFDEVRTIGLFSSRERAIINEGKTLTVTLLPKRKLLIELFGNDGVLAELDWLTKNDDGTVDDINLFRAKAVGGIKSVRRILKFFGLSQNDISGLLDSRIPYSDDLIEVSTSNESVNNYKQINIKFTATV